MALEEVFHRVEGAEIEMMRAENGGSDGRTVYGILVPWGVRQRIDDALTEVFERGSADHVIEAGERGRAPGGLPAYRMHFSRGHERQGGKPCGRTLLLRDDAAGLYGEWRLSNTTDGNDLLELIKDGVYRELSVGFRCAPSWSRTLPDGTVSRTRFDPFEAASVLRGAYAEAAVVTGVRAEEETGGTAGSSRLVRARTLLADWPVPCSTGGLGSMGLRAADPKKPYGDVTYADPGYQKDHKKRYPINTKDHAMAAWSYINQAKNAAKYSPEHLKAIKGRIRAALKRFGVEVAA
jgi:Escherichia/Staphylococcus phage prohead protease